MRALLRRLISRSPRLRGLLAGQLGRELTTVDLDFLRAIPNGLIVSLDRQIELDVSEPGLPSVFWSMLWEASAGRKLSDGLRKRVEFRLRHGRFFMELDLAESPECGYLVRNPTVAITRELLRGGETMLDVGANAGFHSLTAALFFRRVVAFEPTPTTAARLSENVTLSDFPHVHVERCALSDRDGEAHLTIRPGHCGENRIAEAGVAVAVRSIDSLDREQGLGSVDFMKIDVEGHECEVIAGAAELLARDRPRLMVEFNTPAKFDRFLRLLPKGYRAIRPGSDLEIRDGRDAVAARDVLFAP